MDITAFKLDRHKERLLAVFEKYDEGLAEEGKTLKVTQVKTLLNDFAYIGGIVYCFLKEYKETK